MNPESGIVYAFIPVKRRIFFKAARIGRYKMIMQRIFASLSLAALLGACGYVSEYEKAVYDWEPTYCYKSIGRVACYNEPYHRDEKRLVNYFGPDPSRYDKPEAPEATPFDPPEMVNYWVKDPEPIPRPAPSGNIANLPWLDPAVARADADKREFARLVANPKGTRALLGRMGIGPGNARNAKGQASAPVPALRKTNTDVSELPGNRPPLQPAPAAQPTPPVIEVDMN